ncbi:type IV pilus secretin PilQ [Salinisphaera orenii]|uniref:type IV pilus secretin PilQ n=1 Tax=Salinisphaera orenii TaxID=856731 RepID=UPI001FEA40E9|nr:type IV pilus secretin PilQ [Salinisphaera halophila]
MLLWALATTAAQAADNRLISIDAAERSSQRVTLRLKLAGTAPEPSVFTVNEPARLSIDLPNTDLDVAERYQRIDTGPVQAVALAAAGGRTRVVVELTHMVDYAIDRRGDEVRVDIGGGRPTARAPAAERSAPVPASTPARPGTNGPAIDDIDFRRGENGAGRVEIGLQGVDTPVDVDTDDSGRVVARLPGVALPRRLEKRLDVLDFATPVEAIDTLARNGGAQVAITPVADAEYEQVAYQTDDAFIVELQPLTAAEKAEREAEQESYTGEKISLSFQSVDVRAVLQIIADVADVNMVVSDSVTGNMALRLEEVPWDQALDIIMNAKGLGMRRENNVISVAPLAEIAAREQAELAARQATRNLAPLRSEIIQINYARAADIANILRAGRAENGNGNAATGETGGRDVSFLSARGQVTVDDRTNSLLINETREKIDDIRRLVARLDIPVRQVLIESRIVVANRNFSRNLGVSSSAIDNAAYESATGGNYLVDSGYSVELPVSNPAGIITTSIISDTFNLDLALSALESENRGDIISAPRVITADGQEANIEQGEEIPYLEATEQGTATTQFKKAVLSLKVTPQITPNDRIIMSLDVSQDSRGQDAPVQGGGSAPAIDTRSIQTQVLVKDGETVVLGGIYEQENRDVTDRVPLLGELPLVGALFRGTERQRDKRELLLFVTPKILKESLQLDR